MSIEVRAVTIREFEVVFRQNPIFTYISSFPTVMHIAVVTEISHSLLPALTGLHQALAEKATAFDHIIKIGRTHLQV